MKPILLIGSRQDNRQLITAAESTGRKIVGIVDRFYLNQIHDGLPIVASDLDLLDISSDIYRNKDDYDWFVSTIFTGVTNHKVNNENSWFMRNQRASIALTAKLNLINIQHSNSFVDPTCTMGKNIYIGWGCYFGAYCNIGSFTHFAYNCGLGHHTTISDYCTISSTITVGNSTIGKNVFLGPGINISRRGKSVTSIGDNSIIIGGSPILKSVPPNTIYFDKNCSIKNQHFVFDR